MRKYCHKSISALQRERELSYYHRDEQLSTAYITGGNGEIQNSYLYDAFGAEAEVYEQFSNRIRYTGQQYDEFIEQYYLRARYYNPILGRFMQEDVNQGDGLNLYAYCGNNPVVYYDPSGYAGKKSSKCSVQQDADPEGTDTVPENSRGVGGKGWRGDKNWRDDVNTIGEGGTIESLRGLVPTEQEAVSLIKESGGIVNRIEGPHNPPNPHNYNHINYTTPSGGKGTIQIQ